MTRYYQPLGRVHFFAPLIMLTGGIGAAFALGLLFGILTVIDPFIYIMNLIGTVALGIIAGLAFHDTGRSSRLRIRPIANIRPLFIALCAIYANGVGWTFGFYQFEELATTPRGLAMMAQIAVADGRWSVFGWTPSIWHFYLIWFSEAGIILCCGVAAAARYLGVPYCERCQIWTRTVLTVRPLAPVEERCDFVHQLEREEYRVLESLTRLAEDTKSYMKILIKDCPSCRSFKLATFSRVDISTPDEMGKVKTMVETFCTDLLIDAKAFGMLQRLQEEPIEVKSNLVKEEKPKLSPVAESCVRQVLHD